MGRWRASFYAALSKFTYFNGRLEIDEINYYARDVFTFHDRTDGSPTSKERNISETGTSMG